MGQNLNLFEDICQETHTTPLKTGKLLSNLKKSLLLLVIWFLIIFLLLTPLFVKDTSTNTKKQYIKKLPAILWYNYITSTTTKVKFTNNERRIGCFKDSMFFGCKMLAKGSVEEPEAYLFYGASIDRFPLPRGSKIWGLLHEETPVSKLMLMHERALNLFNFSSTYSRHSDVPIPLLWFRGQNSVTDRKYFVKTKVKNLLLTEIAPVMYMQSHCDTLVQRDEFVTKLMKYIKVDSYGYCIRNRELPLEVLIKSKKKSILHYYQLYHEDLLKFVAKYKFIVSIENAVCNDYMTEKLWRSIELGVVPIYYGSPLIRDWLPNNKSAILLEDFPTPELLSRHLHYLLRNDTAYEEYLEHKTLGLVSNKKLSVEMTARPYQTDIEEVIKKFECFICEKLHENNDNKTNIVTKKHYNCPIPTDVKQPVEVNTPWLGYIEEANVIIDMLFEEMGQLNRTLHQSDTSCIDNVYIIKNIFGDD